MKRIAFILTISLAVILLLGGCASQSPIYHTDKVVYEGTLTSANLVPTGYSSVPGSVILDNKTVVLGYFRDARGKTLKDLTLGIPCRILFAEQGTSYTYYYIEQNENK
jgi:uncharacterized protein YceK